MKAKRFLTEFFSINYFILFFQLTLFGSSFSQIAEHTVNVNDFAIGKTISFDSRVLNETRELNIYIPNETSPDSNKVYSVIYLLDGSKDEDFVHIAGLVQFASFPWLNWLEETIVVGIANTDRHRDFTFPSDHEHPVYKLKNRGGSEKFMEYIQNEVQPLIDSTFNTNQTKILIGQSLGGLLASEILLKKPEMFSHYIIVSPSLWYDNESLLELEPQNNTTVDAVYIAVGNEGDVMKRPAKQLFKKLNFIKTEHAQIMYGYYKDKDHGDILHQAVYDALEVMFMVKGK
jgi:predicted alpha/beta superfamily hydrolase